MLLLKRPHSSNFKKVRIFINPHCTLIDRGLEHYCHSRMGDGKDYITTFKEYAVGFGLGVVAAMLYVLFSKNVKYVAWMVLSKIRFKNWSLPKQDLTESIYCSVPGLHEMASKYLLVDDCVLDFNPSSKKDEMNSYPMVCKRVIRDGFMIAQMRGTILVFIDSKFYGKRNKESLDQLLEYFHEALDNVRLSWLGQLVNLLRNCKLRCIGTWIAFKHRNMFIVDVAKTSFEQGRLSFYRRETTNNGTVKIHKVNILKLTEASKVVHPLDPSRRRYDVDYAIIYSGNDSYYLEFENKLAFDLSHSHGFEFARCLICAGVTNKRLFFLVQLFFGRKGAEEILSRGYLTLENYLDLLCFIFKKTGMCFYVACYDQSTVDPYSEIIGEGSSDKKCIQLMCKPPQVGSALQSKPEALQKVLQVSHWSVNFSETPPGGAIRNRGTLTDLQRGMAVI